MTGSGRLTDTTDPTEPRGFVCPQHPNERLEPMKTGNGQHCPVCYLRYCRQCGKHDEGSWMTGVCDGCYSANARARDAAERERRVAEMDELRDLRAQLVAARRTEAETKAEALREVKTLLFRQGPGPEDESPAFRQGWYAARDLAASLLAQPETPEQT